MRREVIHDDVSLKFEYVTAKQAPPSLLDRGGENEKETNKQKDSENETEEILDDTETGLEDEIEDETVAENDPEVKNMTPGNREKAPPLIFGASRKGFHIDKGGFRGSKKRQRWLWGKRLPH